MGDGILPFGRADRSSTLSKETLVLLRCYGVTGFQDSALEVLGSHLSLVVGDLDGTLLDVSSGRLDPGELVQLVLDRSLAVAAAHVRYIERLVCHVLSSLYPEEPLDGGGELLYLLVSVLALLYGRPDAVLYVVLEQDGADLLQRRDDAGDLGQDVDAVGLLVHHPLHAADLALDPP